MLARPGRQFDRLDEPVLRPGDGDEPAAEPGDALVMGGRHVQCELVVATIRLQD